MAPQFNEESSSNIDSCIDVIALTTPISQDISRTSYASATEEVRGLSEDDSYKYRDAFLYYSNDEIRMKTLKLQYTNGVNTNIESSQHERKTRLSFELDPMLVMKDAIEELVNGDELNAIDVDYDKLGCGDDSRMNLLAELLRI